LKKHRLKIFVVDDNSFCLALYEQFLINKGFEDFLLFDNGMDCLQQFHMLPDIVLLDHDMSGINGIDLLKKIKAIDDDIYVIMISGHKNPEARINALRHGVYAFIPKDEQDLTVLEQTLMMIMEEKLMSK
jgi:DNA-binding NtrC family response regulator